MAKIMGVKPGPEYCPSYENENPVRNVCAHEHERIIIE